jgi:PLP dependent protein
LSVLDNYKDLLQKIEAAAKKVGRQSSEIKIIAVTKFAEDVSIKEAIKSGILDLGENRIQVALPKVSLFKDSPVNWHFLGHIQTNKVKQVITNFALIHSVDSLKLARAIEKEAAQQNIKVNILIQVNISSEETKYGFTEEEVMPAVEEIKNMAHVQILGLMTMAPYYDDPELCRPVFRSLRTLKEEIEKRNIENVQMKYLSMGMTNDFDVAIQEGANLIRIGTALFR